MKRPSAVPHTTFSVKRNSATPIHRQVFEWLRTGITTGKFPPRSQLPPTRVLAAELGVARATVAPAFEQLVVEGYVTGKTGSGTFVSEALPEDFLQIKNPARRTPGVQGRRSLSKRGRVLSQGKVTFLPAHSPVRPFRPGSPAIDAFPWDLWKRSASKCQRRMPRSLLGYPHPAGYSPLRSAIAAYLRVARDVVCEPDQVLIVPSAQLAIDLALRALLDPGEAVWMEDPGYLGAQNAMRGAGARLIPVPVDSQGLQVEIGIERCPSARLAYVTPSHQYPMGTTMSYPRRLALLNWAKQSGAWILEDDYDSEFRYVGQPLTSLRGLDSHGRVLYLGTFSKVLFPALRLAYVVVPPDLVDPLTAALEAIGADPPSQTQLVLTEFMNAGFFVQHIRQMRRLYAERQNTFLKIVRSELAGLLEIFPNDSGMRLLGWLPPGSNDVRASQAAALEGVEAHPLSAYCVEAKMSPGLLLGYTAFTESQMRSASQRLAIALADYRAALCQEGRKPRPLSGARKANRGITGIKMLS